MKYVMLVVIAVMLCSCEKADSNDVGVGINTKEDLIEALIVYREKCPKLMFEEPKDFFEKLGVGRSFTALFEYTNYCYRLGTEINKNIPLHGTRSNEEGEWLYYIFELYFEFWDIVDKVLCGADNVSELSEFEGLIDDLNQPTLLANQKRYCGAFKGKE